jgi:predicted Fe-S protein YdhL (DUF1289 family)
MTDTPAVQSPCIRVCRLNERNECFGCFRTEQEILGWARLGADERQAVIELAGTRKTNYWEAFASRVAS